MCEKSTAINAELDVLNAEIAEINKKIMAAMLATPRVARELRDLRRERHRMENRRVELWDAREKLFLAKINGGRNYETA